MISAFKSNVARYILWGVLLLIIGIDFYGIWHIYSAQVELATFMKVLLALGVILKLSILYCLLEGKGPIRGLTNTWGSLFALSGSSGLLSLALSEQVEPIQAYFDKAIFLALGLAIILIASKYISYAQPQEN